MTILSRVCAEFHDKHGAVLYTVRANQLLAPLIDVPESIRQDPLFDMLVAEGSLDVLEKKADLKHAEMIPRRDRKRRRRPFLPPRRRRKLPAGRARRKRNSPDADCR